MQCKSLVPVLALAIFSAVSATAQVAPKDTSKKGKSAVVAAKPAATIQKVSVKPMAATDQVPVTNAEDAQTLEGVQLIEPARKPSSNPNITPKPR